MRREILTWFLEEHKCFGAKFDYKSIVLDKGLSKAIRPREKLLEFL